MKDLTAIFQKAGCEDVKTYIQSGNVIFRAPSQLMATLGSEVTSRITQQFGIQVPVVLRSREELDSAIRNNPFAKTTPDENFLYVMFLADEPDTDGISKLDPQRSPPDEFIVRSREIYLHLPNGAGRSKLTNSWFDSRLKTVSTSRNWRTVLKLYELTGPE